MGSKNDGNNLNPEAKILVEAYQQYRDNTISKEDAIKIEKIDDILKTADIQFNQSHGLVVDDKGLTLKVQYKERKQAHQPPYIPGANLKLDRALALEPNEDANILATAYREFSKNGLTHDETVKLEKIDDVLKDADIQINKNGAVVIDNKTNAINLKPSR